MPSNTTMTPKAEEFFARVTKLAGLDIENYEFHCEECQKVFCSIQSQAERFVGDAGAMPTGRQPATFSVKQLDFARNIFTKKGCAAKKATTSNTRGASFDPNEVIERPCVHKDKETYFKKETKDGVELRTYIKENGKKKEFTRLVPCTNMVRGTRAQIGAMKTMCTEHQA